MRNRTSSIAISDGITAALAPAPLQVAKRRYQPIRVDRAGVLAGLDSIAAIAAILAVLISDNLASFPQGVDSFLSARITVKNVLLLIFLATAWPVVFQLFGLYDAKRVRRLGAEASRLVAATAVGSALATVFPLTSVTGAVMFSHVPYFWLSSLALCLFVRTGRRVVDRVHLRQARRTLIVGTGRLARRALRDLRLDRTQRYEVVGFVDDTASGRPAFDEVGDAPIGTLLQLEQILMREVIDEVVIALPIKSCYQQIQHVIGVCERAGVQAKYGADMFESAVAFPRYHAHGDRAFVALQVIPDAHRLAVKRLIDILGATVGLILLAPLMLIIAIAVKLTSSGPVIYAHDRCGLNRRPFRMYKFRSMYADADRLQDSLEDRNEAKGPVFKIRHDPRVTPLGRLLRKSSLDELPQFVNVLLGDMSLVGPRPLPMRDIRRIVRPSDMRRCSMRPGITCLWQVQGRNKIDFEHWVNLDLEYIDNWSLGLDARILLQTVPAVVTGDGAA
jgi:exopolysaccharide biosynthesis polyprenyl glycosylphosphotransferase